MRGDLGAAVLLCFNIIFCLLHATHEFVPCLLALELKELQKISVFDVFEKENKFYRILLVRVRVVHVLGSFIYWICIYLALRLSRPKVSERARRITDAPSAGRRSTLPGSLVRCLGTLTVVPSGTVVLIWISSVCLQKLSVQFYTMAFIFLGFSMKCEIPTSNLHNSVSCS